MNYSIIVSSKTGNAGILADRIHEIFNENVVYYGKPDNNIPDADIMFIGFWTNMGTCDNDTAAFLKTLHNKKIFLFGTAGFGESEEYFLKILGRTKEFIDASNTIVGEYMCQGKMPLRVREKYEAMKASKPDMPNIDLLINNFDKALSHPDESDLKRLISKLAN